MTWPSGAWPLGRAAGDADVVLLGDSITSGQGASSYWSSSWAARVRAGLRTSYGDGGSGFSPHWTGAPGGGTVTGTPATAFAASVPNGHVSVLTGSMRWTHQAEGDEVAVYLRRRSADGTARWRADGGPWQPVACTGADGYVRSSATGLGPGAHVIDVEAASGTVAVAGTEGRNTLGCRVHVMGLGARTSGGNAFSTPTFEANAPFRAATVGRWSPHLLVVALGVNDSNTAGIDATTYRANVTAYADAARASRPTCDVLLVAHHLGRFADNDYDGMRSALRAIADDVGAVVVDLDAWARTLPDGTTTARTAVDPTGTSWGRWSTWGWWAGATDSVHPGDTGHLMLAHVLGQVVTAVEPEDRQPVEEIEFGGLVT